MIMPIVGYGSPVLKTKCADITENSDELKTLIKNMWDTMYNANGVGLAAPQIGKAIRLFVMDSVQLLKNKNTDEDDADESLIVDPIKQVFINPKIVSKEGKEWAYTEGCLSIPNIREDVYRPDIITIEFLDENFKKKQATFNTINARIIQHEYDHIEGILFTDLLKPLKRKLLKKKLEDIAKGYVDADYKMKFGVK